MAGVFTQSPSRRILLADINAADAVTRKMRWRGWNNSDKSANVSLQQGTMESGFFSYAVMTAGSSGGVRSIGTITERTYVEFTCISKTSNPLSVGVSRSDIAIATVPGNSPSIAVYRSDGNFRNNSANTAASTGTWTSGDIIGMFLDPITSPGNLLIWWTKNGATTTNGMDAYTSATYTLANGTGTNWHIYVGAEVAAGTIHINLGQDKFRRRGRGYFPGLPYADAAGGGTWRYANGRYITQTADSPANTPYDPRIIAVPEFSKEIGSFIWGNSRSTTSIGYLDLNNSDGGVDSMLTYDLRDAAVTLYVVGEDEPFSSATVVARAIVDRVDALNHGVMRVVLRDKSAILDKPFLISQYSDTVPNTALKGQFRPMAVGSANSVELIQYDQANLIYDLVDQYRLSATGLRDQGLSVSTFTLAGKADCNGVTRTTAPAGVQTSSCTAIRLGAQKLGVAQNGDFANWTADNPNTWTTTDPNTAVNKITQVGNTARFLANGALGVGGLQITQNVFSAGVDRPYFEVNVTTWVAGQLEVCQAGTVIGTISGPGIWRFTLTFTALGADFTLRAKAGVATDMNVDYAYAWAYFTTSAITDALTYLIETRAGFSSGDWSSSDVSNILSALCNDSSGTGTAWNTGYYATSQVNISDVLSEILDSMLSFWYVDLNGVIRIGSVDVPLDTSSAALNLTEDDILEDSVAVEFDEMSGAAEVFLGNRNERPLTDGEFAGAVSAADRQTLKAAFQVRRAPGATDSLAIAKCYAFLKGREQETRNTTDAIGIKGLPYRVRQLCLVPRFTIRLRCTLRTQSLLTLKLSDFVTVVLPRFGLTSGKTLLLKKIAGRFDSNIVELTLWV